MHSRGKRHPNWQPSLRWLRETTIPLDSVRELLLPRACAGCHAPGHVLCPACQRHWSNPPYRITTRVDARVPIWALGPYSQIRQRTVVSIKERNNTEVRGCVAAVLRAGVETLWARGEVPEEAVLVPAPTRRRAARQRGGDPVQELCLRSGIPCTPLCHYRASVKDSVGLSADQRLANVTGAVCVRGVPGPSPSPALIVDDVATTGATVRATAAALWEAGFTVVGALVLAAA